MKKESKQRVWFFANRALARWLKDRARLEGRSRSRLVERYLEEAHARHKRKRVDPEEIARKALEASSGE